MASVVYAAVSYVVSACASYGSYVALAVSIGSYLYSSSQSAPDFDNTLKADGSTVSPADTGLGFAAYPQYPAGELPIPVIYGKARLNGLIVHSRPYGNNFEKCHYLLVWGDRGYNVDQIYIDKYRLEDLPNYYENIEGAEQDTTNSWANTYPSGGEIQIILNNSGVFGVMMGIATVGTVTAHTPAIFYGGGTIKCRSLHTWPQYGSRQRWLWKLTNLNDVSKTYSSPTYYKYFNTWHTIGSADFYSPGQGLREYTFNVPDTLSKWSITLICTQMTGGERGERITFYDYEIVDTPYNEIINVNATVSYVHLVKDKSLTSNQPVVNAIVYKTENGNPATSLYEYLTDTAVGLGLPNVDWVSASETGAWCVTNDLYYNRAITAFYGDDKLIKEMCTCGRIVLYEENGAIKMRPDKTELVSYLVDDTEIIPGSLKIGLNSKTTPNRVEGQYTEPFYGYTIERIYAEDYEDILKTGLRSVTLGLAGVTGQKQAHDLAYLALNHVTRSKYWCSFDTGLETVAMFKIGDVIEITSDTNALIDGKKWRVQKIDEKDLFTFNVYCKHYVDEIYDFPDFSPWYETITDLEPLHGWPGPVEGPATVINVVFSDVVFPVGCHLRTSITMAWVNPTERFQGTSISYSHNNIDWIHCGSTTAAASYEFTWPMRWGIIYVKIVSLNNGETNAEIAPVVSKFITGDPLCTGDNRDYPGYGVGQFGIQAWGR